MNEPARLNIPEWTVSELSAALKKTVEDAFGYVRVRGEISGFRGPHSSGHCYFSLKDEGAKVEAVIWRSALARMRIKPEEGLEVRVTGRLTTYPNKSTYQIVIETLEPAGVGALMALVEERKKKLAAEGLFDEARKQLLPFLPQRIGVITSPTGAVIRDILHRLADRFPRHVMVWPVRVQGDGCAEQVAAAIHGFNALALDSSPCRPDLLIVARGGGSLEDLWSFNEEIVVRAAAASMIPLICAAGRLGPQILRARVMRGCELVTALTERAKRAEGIARQRRREQLATATARLSASLRANADAHRSRIGRQGERIAELSERARRAVHSSLSQRAAFVERCGQLLNALSHRGVLARGFALVRDPTGRPLRQAAAVSAGMRLDVEFSDGHVRALAEGVFPAATERPVPKPR